MVSFFVCLAILIIGYFTYGRVIEHIYGPDDRETPAVRINDGVDFVVMPKWKLFLVQLLNIAGLGPIYGALAGAQWGPAVFLWITFGTILAGAVHDFSVGFISMRHDGTSVLRADRYVSWKLYETGYACIQCYPACHGRYRICGRTGFPDLHADR